MVTTGWGIKSRSSNSHFEKNPHNSIPSLLFFFLLYLSLYFVLESDNPLRMKETNLTVSGRRDS